VGGNKNDISCPVQVGKVSPIGWREKPHHIRNAEVGREFVELVKTLRPGPGWPTTDHRKQGVSKGRVTFDQIGG
jgi:hypothetical protein